MTGFIGLLDTHDTLNKTAPDAEADASTLPARTQLGKERL